MESKINEAFEKWKNKYVKENDNIDYDLIILEDMLASWNASRIDFAKEIKKKWLNQDFSEDDGEGIIEYIDTELNKGK